LTPELRQTVSDAWDAYFKSSISSLLLPDAPETKVDDAQWETLLASLQGSRLEELKAKQEKFSMHLTALKAARLALSQASTSSDLIQAASPILAPYLDAQHGSTLTDPALFRALPAEMEASFFADMAALRVERPTTLTRVTEYVPEIVAFVERIIANGYAYAAGPSVYFDVNAFEGAKAKSAAAGEDDAWTHVYAKLHPWSKGDSSLLQEGEGSLSSGSGKRSKTDFALWKGSKPGEPAWDSPWGPGRPGWHIECSVMASAVLGNGMDIHSGGIDLAFPHHDNELAQAEAYHDCRQWVNYFLHTGHLHIEGLKMSKSLKNYITIQEALQRNTARQLRLAFMLQPWAGRMDFKESAMVEVKAREALFNNFFANAKAIVAKAAATRTLDGLHHFEQAEADLMRALQAAQAAFHEALCDSFDMPKAMDVLSSLVTQSNTYINARSPFNTSALEAVAQWVTRMLRMFGLGDGPATTPIGWGEGGSEASGSALDVSSTRACSTTTNERSNSATPF
jgi:cysteinyl-tRNA synthetase